MKPKDHGGSNTTLIKCLLANKVNRNIHQRQILHQAPDAAVNKVANDELNLSPLDTRLLVFHLTYLWQIIAFGDKWVILIADGISEHLCISCRYVKQNLQIVQNPTQMGLSDSPILCELRKMLAIVGKSSGRF